MDVRLQIVAPSARPPDGDGWLHEIKHDGHRLVAIVPKPGRLRLLSRKGNDRTPIFRAPFQELAARGRPIVLDGEIAVSDDRGVTHIDLLQDAFGRHGADRLTYYAFDLLYLDGHDLRRCPIEDRKALLRQVLDDAGSERLVYVDHIAGRGAELFERVREAGAEGIVSKRRGSLYRGRESRDWLKTKCHEVGEFVVTGFQELGDGRLEAIHVAEARDEQLRPAGQIRWGFAGKGLWDRLDRLRSGRAIKGIIPISPTLPATVKFFGRHKGGAIRDGVILSLARSGRSRKDTAEKRRREWLCDSDEVIGTFDRHEDRSAW